MNIITVSGEMGSLRDELAAEICRSGARWNWWTNKP